MAIDGKRIQRVTKEGLFYLDETGQEAFIDFEACYEHKLAEFMEPETLKKFREINRMTDQALARSIERRTMWKDVADTNVIGHPMGSAPYIEFYTDPPIRFEFATENGFDEVRDSIEEYQWKTFDRS